MLICRRLHLSHLCYRWYSIHHDCYGLQGHSHMNHSSHSMGFMTELSINETLDEDCVRESLDDEMNAPR